MFFDWLQFVFNLIIAGFFLRWLEVKTAGSDMGKALAFVY